MNPIIYRANAVTCPDRGFVRGFVAAACVSAFQDIDEPFTQDNLLRLVRQGVQGGIALAAGTSTVDAVRRRDYGSALLAVAVGAAGVYATEVVLNKKSKQKKGK